MYQYTLFCLMVTSNLMFVASQRAQDGSLLSLVNGMQELSMLKSYVSRTSLREHLSRSYPGTTKITFFAPSNEAFSRLTSAERSLLSRNDYLEDVLKYHVAIYNKDLTIEVIKESVQSVPPDNMIPTLNDNAGRVYFNFSRTDTQFDERFFVNQAEINKDRPQLASNGRLYVVDRVFINPPESRPIGPVISNDRTNNLGKFRELLTAYADHNFELNSVLSYEPRITFFAVNDEGMGKVPAAVRNKLKSDVNLLGQVLNAHLVKGTMWFTGPLLALVEGQTVQSETEGGTIYAMRIGNDVYVSSKNMAGKIVKGDIMCNNGVLHIINNLMYFTYNTAASQVSQAPQLRNSFKRMVDESNDQVKNQFQSPTTMKTIFAPIELGFQAIPPDNYTAVMQSKERKSQIVGYHMIVGQVLSFSRMTNNSVYFGLRFFKWGKDTYVDGHGVRAKIVEFDVGLTDGVMHYIDHVLGIPYRSCEQEISNNPWTNVEGYSAYIQPLPELRDYLQSGSRNKTFFAPNDTAVMLIEQDPDLQEIFDAQWRDKLRDVMKTHTIPGRHFFMDSSQLNVGDRKQYQTEWGTVTIMKERAEVTGGGNNNGGNDGNQWSRWGPDSGWDQSNPNQGQQTTMQTVVYVEHANKVRARIIQGDIETTNGVVHIIDRMLFAEEDFHRTSGGAGQSLSLVLSLALVVLGAWVM